MTNEEKAAHNRELCRRYQAGDKKAGEELIRFNERFIQQIIGKRIYRCGSDLPNDDLAQEGRIGLLKAAERFDLSRETGFLTYAEYYINQHIIRANVWQGHNIRMPDNIFTELNKLDRTENKYGYLPTEERRKKVREYMDYPEYRLNELYRIRELVQTETISDMDDAEVDEYLKAEDGECMEDRAIDRLLREYLEQAMSEHLTPKEIDVVKRRSGWLSGGDPETLESIAWSMNVTRERVRQIEMRAYRKLSRKLWKLKDFA